MRDAIELLRIVGLSLGVSPYSYMHILETFGPRELAEAARTVGWNWRVNRSEHPRQRAVRSYAVFARRLGHRLAYAA